MRPVVQEGTIGAAEADGVMPGANLPRALMLAALATGAAAGCLPAGNVPVGQHVLSDRTVSRLSFLPAPSDTHPRLIVQDHPRPLVVDSSTDPGVGFLSDVVDLYLLPELPEEGDGAAAAPNLEDWASLIVAGAWEPQIPCDRGICGQMNADALGRIFVSQPGLQDPVTETFQQILLRVDPATGQSVRIGNSTGPTIFSPTRKRVATASYDEMPVGTVVRELGDETTNVGAFFGLFVNEDYYFQDQDAFTLNRLPSFGPPEIVARDVITFTVSPTADGPVLWICHATPVAMPMPMPMPTCQSSSFLDLDTLREIPISNGPMPTELLATSSPQLSPDGGKALFFLQQLPYPDTPLMVVDRANPSASETVRIPGVPVVVIWRPGHDEIWIEWQDPPSTTNSSSFNPSSQSGHLTVWKLGEGLTEIATTLADPPQAFTSDGRYWFHSSHLPGTSYQADRLYVCPADDPLAPGFPTNPPGTAILGTPQQLADGRLLGEGSFRDFNRNDISVVDPETGAAFPLATGGHVIAVGQTRILTLLRWIASTRTGDLTLIDLHSGVQTLIAENVFEVSLERDIAPPNFGVDPLASGARVAYLVQSRLASPYDGLWIATLP